MKKLVVALCCFVSLAQAQKGTFTTLTTTWNHLTRIYSVYVPPILQVHPAMVMALHGTADAAQSSPPLTACTHGMQWDMIADANGFLLLCPIASYKPGGTNGGRFFWESYGTETYFPCAPDDSGFLRHLILAMEKSLSTGGFGVDPHRVFVMGFSSGGMMTHRVAIDSADLVAAAAPLSGTLWAGNPDIVMPLPSRPVSILEMHGDLDTTVDYCGGLFWGWGEGNILLPSVDVDLNYWLSADGTPSNPTPLCSGGNPSPNVFRLNFSSADGKTDVEFVRELGFAHTYKTWTIASTWEFFGMHGR